MKNKLALVSVSLLASVSLLTGCSTAAKTFAPTSPEMTIPMESDVKVPKADKLTEFRVTPLRDTVSFSDDTFKMVNLSEDDYALRIMKISSGLIVPDMQPLLDAAGVSKYEYLSDDDKRVFKNEYAAQMLRLSDEVEAYEAQSNGLSVGDYKAVKEVNAYKTQKAMYERDQKLADYRSTFDSQVDKAFNVTPSEPFASPEVEANMLIKERNLQDRGIDVGASNLYK